ncbi:hypothetical protein ACFWQG_12970 [Rhodococcus sp. NPDC058532]|uniref:hypothetical protein n=1 Tax=Rhodococcus sp. NPDC058532 TaxID=3346540 RepID=UPI00364B51FD
MQVTGWTPDPAYPETVLAADGIESSGPVTVTATYTVVGSPAVNYIKAIRVLADGVVVGEVSASDRDRVRTVTATVNHAARIEMWALIDAGTANNRTIAETGTFMHCTPL